MKTRVLIVISGVVLLIVVVVFFYKKNPATVSLDTLPTEAIAPGVTATPNAPALTKPPAANTVSPVNEKPTPDLKLKKIPTPQAIPQEANLEPFQKMSIEPAKAAAKRMQDDEIRSLKASIENDEKLLKKLEASGTGAEDYKFIEGNLAKRKRRLQVLLK